MSRAPVFAEDYTVEDRAFAEATVELNRRVDEGTSWSGNERNQLFLNLGIGSGGENIPDFANASALAGFDLPDDSRALVSIDWDFDGDLDFLTSNRSAPRVRIFENRMSARAGSSLAVQLIGTTENRDAIGSRFELDLRDSDGTAFTLSRTLHGGQGFLSQSSRWLHFGIPHGAAVINARAIWGSNETEAVEGIDAGRFLIVRQGSGTAESWPAPRHQIPASAVAESEPVPTSQTIVAHLERPIPLPRVPFTGIDGEPGAVMPDRERALVINLWATWCAPCVAELSEFTAKAKKLTDAGADVLALCVDADPSDPAAMAKARMILAETGFPFEAGYAGERALSLLHFVHGSAFLRPEKLPVPTTLVIGPGSRVHSILQGTTSPDEIVEILGAIQSSSGAWASFSQPAAGRWAHGPDQVYYSSIAKDMLERGWIEEMAEFLISHEASLKPEGKKYAEMLMLTGTKLLETGDAARGLELLQAAVGATPDLAIAHNNLAVALLQSNRGEEAAEHLLAAIASAPGFVDPKVNLARYYAAEGRHTEALELTRPILEGAYHPGAIRVSAQRSCRPG